MIKYEEKKKPNTCWCTRWHGALHAAFEFQGTRNLLQKRRLGVPRDGSVDAAAADRVLRRAADVLHDPILRRGDAEQHHLG